MKRPFIIILSAVLLLTGWAASAAAETKNPHGEIKWDCQKCHTPDSWTEMRKPLTFAHDETDFPLIGSHRATRCAGCHRDLVFSKVSSACSDCHSDPHKGQMGLACEKCHTSENWQNREDVFNLHMQKGFALTGVHAIADCNSCHQGQHPEQYATTPTTCQGCHMPDYTATGNPNHVQAGFRFDCESCHSPRAVTWTAVTYEHPLPFRLEGAHRVTDCNSCHATTYVGTENTCFGCHENDYRAAVDPNHVQASFDHDCTACHVVVSWTPAHFDHSRSQFALTGAHETVACNKCHQTTYSATTTSCYGCHQQDFVTTTKPKHVTGGFPTGCQTCHTSVAWSPATFDHSRTRFSLTGAHVSATCDKCHASGYAGTSMQCFSCHQTNFTAAVDPNHVQNKFDHTCEQCHTTTSWTPAVFDHSATRFPLTGAHQSVACAQCHTTGYAGTPTTCYSCHQQTFADVRDPNHVTDAFEHDCLKCHTTVAWTTTIFDHNLTQFALTGAHVSVTCNTCHKTGFDATASACYACHQTEFAGTTAPNHVASGFPTECQVCHTTTAWTPSGFDHSRTSFPLTGAHQAAVCSKCHTAGYAGTPSDCYSCHKTEYAGMKNPDHVLGNFDHNCLTCHTTATYKPSTFNHSATSFTLTGAHQTVACNLCHAATFAGTPGDCYSCHQTTFAAAKDPDHAGSNFDHDCLKCHSTSAWTPATFDHNLASFALTGAHQSVACTQCHVTGFTGTPSDCYSCHQTTFAGVIDPNHVTNSFDHNCLKCHTTTVWLPVNFDHGTTAFPLTGAHVSVTCNTCHKTGFAGTSSTCNACHQTDFASTTKPDHTASAFPTECQICHTTSAWTPSVFNHSATGFALTGAHQTATCDKCHASGYAGTPSDCYSCHQANFTGVADPNHVSNNFDHDCLKCHTTSAWLPVSFDHSTTGFTLTGAHIAVTCNTCHKTGFAGTSSTCYSCHQTNYTNTTQPNHASLGFPTECQVCHNTSAWVPSNFDHSTTSFALVGAHQAATCDQCHASGYAGTPTDCYSCHQSDFKGVVDPNHVTNNFDHNCVKCHSTSAWLPVTFDHNATSFPLTGAHVAVTCNTCHNTGFAGTPSTCYACHQTNYVNTTAPSHATSGFPTECQVCHATSAWTPASFDHSATGFTLTGAHVPLACVQCHASGYTSTPNTCYACHSGDFAGVTDPNHVTNNFDRDCTKCHSTTAWQPATFNHSTTAFPLTGAHSAVACIQCHSTGYAGTPTACYSCHTGDFAGASDPNHVTNNLDHDCTKCHSTSAWSPSTFNHSTTVFPLTGAHTAVACGQCHTTGYAGGTPTACYSCHTGDFSRVSDPNHVTNNFDHDCTKCHTTAAWSPATFNHSTTSFPLTGAHTAVACIQCHQSGYTGTPAACYSCHTGDFTSALSPGHVSNNFSHDCTRCHSTSVWSPATFNHSATVFPLKGAHLTVACIQCHTTGYTGGTPTACYSCHAGDFAGVSDPNHVTNNFDHDCTKCHSMTAWSPATFNHNTTIFPLTGAHAAVACVQCHATGYAGTPTACYSCHAGDFTGVLDPNHVTGNFDHVCTKCHSTTAWSPATFNHSLSSFPLTGAHTNVSCINCHQTGYTGTPTVCDACHHSDYTGTTNPNHAAALFPTDCISCHTTTAWAPSTWNHDSQYFPIYSGSHRGRWSTCATCHTNPANFATFECILCHTHSKTVTDSHHTGVRSYQYLSTACYNCHPRGSTG